MSPVSIHVHTVAVYDNGIDTKSIYFYDRLVKKFGFSCRKFSKNIENVISVTRPFRLYTFAPYYMQPFGPIGLFHVIVRSQSCRCRCPKVLLPEND